jgi:hypothetical protein
VDVIGKIDAVVVVVVVVVVSLLFFLVKEEMLDEQDKCKDIQISQHHRNFQK